MATLPRADHQFLVDQGRLLNDSLSSDGKASEEQRTAIGVALTEEVVRLAKALSPAVIVEVGAHDGGLSLRMKGEIPNARVIAFEAHPRVHGKHARRLGEHDIECVNAIVGPVDAVRQLHVPTHDGRERATMGSQLIYSRAETFRTYDVDGVRLDTFLGADADKPNVVWLDVGGAVREVLLGATRTLSNTLVLCARIEDVARWKGQGTAADVVEELARFGLTPIARDIHKNSWQYNAVFVRREAIPETVLERFSVVSAGRSQLSAETIADPPDRSFEHVVVTRFGIGITDPAWYAYRLPLFEATVYASLKNQTAKDFSWRVVVDHRLSKSIMGKLERLRSTFPQMSIVPVNEILSPVFEFDREPDGWVLSSRIDDDDALALDTIALLHVRVGRHLSDRPVADALFTFPVGIEFDTIASTFSEFRYPCHSMSVHVLSHKGRQNCFSQSHATYGVYAQANGMHYEELEPTIPKWLYLRHKLVDSNLRKVPEHAAVDGEFTARIGRTFGIDLRSLNVFLKRQAEVSFAGNRGTRRLQERRSLIKQLRPLIRQIQSNLSRNELDMSIVEKYNTLMSQYKNWSRSAMP